MQSGRVDWCIVTSMVRSGRSRPMIGLLGNQIPTYQIPLPAPESQVQVLPSQARLAQHHAMRPLGRHCGRQNMVKVGPPGAFRRTDPTNHRRHMGHVVGTRGGLCPDPTGGISLPAPRWSGHPRRPFGSPFSDPVRARILGLTKSPGPFFTIENNLLTLF